MSGVSKRKYPLAVDVLERDRRILRAKPLSRPDSSGVRSPVSWIANFSEDEPLLSTRIRRGSMVMQATPLEAVSAIPTEL